MRRTLRVLLALLLAGAPVAAVSTYKGLQPGKSTRAEVDGTLARPARQRGAGPLAYEHPDRNGPVVVD